MSDIRAWLEGLGLGQYAEAFEAEQIALATVPDLTEGDLEKLGLPMGPRKAILRAGRDLSPAPPAAAHAQDVIDDAHAGEAERRQLTVMFCDLVGSTALSEALDPEDLRAVMEAYRAAVTGVIERYDGHVAQYLGDGLMVYFGWPRAHEDDAQRAVRAGLDIVEAVKGLDGSADLAVRLGIATGPVVVGAGRRAQRDDARLAVGETPNLAARIQAEAQANGVVIGDGTRRLIGGAFELRPLGRKRLKGVAGAVPVYGVVGEAATESRFEAAHAGGLTAFIGRDSEIAMLIDRWQSAVEGDGQVVLLCGEPGIGKSRITQVLRERLADRPQTRIRHQCSPYYINSAFYPVIEHLERAAGFARGDSDDARLDKMEALLAAAKPVDLQQSCALIAAMLSLPADRYPALGVEPQKQKDMTIAALVDQVAGLAAVRPVLMLVEDAHWIDPTTLEFLGVLVDRVQTLPVLLVNTYRPEFTPPWSGYGHITSHTLNRLPRRQGQAMVEHLTGGRRLPDEVMDQIVAKTDGVPLFVEELTKTVLEAGFLKVAEDRYELDGPLPPLAIPSTLQDSLMARLDRLSPVKEVAQVGACIGREFSFELLAAVSPLHDNELRDSLQQLVNSELIFARGAPPDATYSFKHALVQDAAYESLLKSKRQQLHTTIATTLEKRFAEKLATEPELAAYHFTSAGLNERAIPYWLAAGQRAVARSANEEAINHVYKGLDLLATLPEGRARDEHELELRAVLGFALMSARGYAAPELRESAARSRELCLRLSDTPHFPTVMFGAWVVSSFPAHYDEASAISEQTVSWAERNGAPEHLVLAYALRACTCLFTGRLVEARDDCERGLALYDPVAHKELAWRYGQNPGPWCADWASWAWWALGYPDKAIELNRHSVRLARATEHPLTIASQLVLASLFHSMRGDVAATLKHAVETMRTSDEFGIPLRKVEGVLLRGWAIAMQGQVEHGIAQVREGMAGWRAVGAEIGRPWWLTLFAQALAGDAQYTLAIEALDEAIDFVERTDERLWEAEIYRIKGVVLLDRDPAAAQAAEANFRKAIAVAQSQQAKSWELRAATSLARLWQSEGKTQEAHDLLASVYNWFTEGFETVDLKEAHALLEALR